LIVRDVVNGKIVLTLAQGDIVVPQLDNFLCSGEKQACTMFFMDVEAQFANKLTAIIDLFTATGTGYTQQNEWPRPSTGLGLVKLRFFVYMHALWNLACHGIFYLAISDF
jgi:hypothetical protein